MTDSPPHPAQPSPALTVRRADAADRPGYDRLWQLFRHDLSALTGTVPFPDGTFRTERLEAAFADPDWAPYLFTRGRSPVGLAIVRGLGAPTRVLNSFFVVAGARGAGHGLHAACQVMRLHPGAWEVAFQDANAPAVRFWRRVAIELAGDAWTEEHRISPARPDLPLDTWIRIGAVS